MPGTTQALLSTDRLTYTLPDGRALLSELTLNFGRERTGIVGRNGVGKTTLVRILAGEIQPSRGKVICRARTLTSS